ncbi:MAG TPA: glycosyltransferase family 4 protein [Gemmataceae bacterium]|jgi:glycosyltransferase involved in cell wall biosynthesis
MRTVLFVIPSLEYSGAARQLTLLAAGLSRESFRVRVAVLGEEAPWVASLRGEGVEVEVLGWRRPFDVRPFLALRRLVGSMQPDVVHVWGAAALHAVVLSGSRRASRLLVSAALSPAGRPSPLDRWLLRRVEGIIAFGTADAERYRRLGVAEACITVVAPAMPIVTAAVEPAQLPGVAASARVLLGLGPIEQHKGFREAVWAFDILRHLYNDVHLVLVGNGSDRPRVEQFVRQIHVTEHVHFLGALAETAPLLHRAELVWAPSQRGGGVCSVLEAMAVGRAVVASRCPDLAEIVVDGETGFLVEPDNKAALARQTRLLLDDAARRRSMGEAGRRRVADYFAVARLVETCGRRYAEDRSS